MFTSSDERTGNFTFTAEGQLDPKSPWYIGRLSHPSADSGVTIGAGYDMKYRAPASVKADLLNAGCPPALAETISKGGKTKDADKFVADNKSAVIEDLQILRNLFAQTYPGYIATAKSNYAFHAKTFALSMPLYGSKYAGATFVAWENLYPSMRIMAVDFTYQGFGTQLAGYGRPLHFCMANNFQWLIDYILTTPGVSKYEGGRHRADYLKKNRGLEESQNSKLPLAMTP